MFSKCISTKWLVSIIWIVNNNKYLLKQAVRCYWTNWAGILFSPSNVWFIFLNKKVLRLPFATINFNSCLFLCMTIHFWVTSWLCFYVESNTLYCFWCRPWSITQYYFHFNAFVSSLSLYLRTYCVLNGFVVYIFLFDICSNSLKIIDYVHSARVLFFLFNTIVWLSRTHA